MAAELSSGVFGKLSELIGATEPAIKLIITVLAGYPLAVIHRKFILNQDTALQHLFFIFSGLLLGYWNYGMQIFHCVFAIFVTYCTLKLLKGTWISVAIVFLFNLIYLLLGYIYTGTNDYDINWTMPFCILTLRLIGVAFDIYDGQQPAEKLSVENKKVALKETPSLLELFGHSLFPASFLIGPQFPMKRYQDFTGGEFCQKDENGQLIPPDSVTPAIKNFLTGAAYLLIFQVLGLYVSDELLLSQEFGKKGFFTRMFLLGLWGRFTLYKYISCWLLTEGACTLFGLSYNGVNHNGQQKWDGVSNVNLSIFENTTEFNHYIQSFNTNTNHWVAQYVYKRLKFLGNRQVSQLAALMFLAVWHGLHTGYYVCFFFEFAVIYMERDIKSIVASNPDLSSIFNNPNVQMLVKLLLRVYTFVFMGWCLLPLALLTFDRYWTAFANVNYVGILLFILWPIVYSPVLRFIFTRKREKFVAQD